jgi:hypothetical protein
MATVQRSERLGANDAQPTMAVLATLPGERPVVDEAPPAQPVREHERHKPTGRKPLPEQLPAYWRTTVENAEARRLLDGNIYRRATLGAHGAFPVAGDAAR